MGLFALYCTYGRCACKCTLESHSASRGEEQMSSRLESSEGDWLDGLIEKLTVSLVRDCPFALANVLRFSSVLSRDGRHQQAYLHHRQGSQGGLWGREQNGKVKLEQPRRHTKRHAGRSPALVVTVSLRIVRLSSGNSPLPACPMINSWPPPWQYNLKARAEPALTASCSHDLSQRFATACYLSLVFRRSFSGC